MLFKVVFSLEMAGLIHYLIKNITNDVCFSLYKSDMIADSITPLDLETTYAKLEVPSGLQPLWNAIVKR